MDLNTIPLEVAVTNAYSKGAIPLNVQGIANVKVSSSEGLLENAAERFLDTPNAQIGQIAKETLEANLRGVLATMSPEEVNEDRLKFSQQLIDEADDDIKTLGLALDVLKIQNVTDDVNYLESVGRRLTAEVVKEARVAEANRTSESEQAEAVARRLAEIAAIEAQKAIVEEQNALRVRTAELEAISKAREEEALVAGETARAVAEQELEQQRIELETRRAEADVVVPARADLQARQMAAQADAGPNRGGRQSPGRCVQAADRPVPGGRRRRPANPRVEHAPRSGRQDRRHRSGSLDRSGRGHRQRRWRYGRRDPGVDVADAGCAGEHDRTDRGRHRRRHLGRPAPERRRQRRDERAAPATRRRWSTTRSSKSTGAAAQRVERRGLDGRGILGPGVFWIAAGHVLAHVAPRTNPEPGEVRRHLHWPVQPVTGVRR